MIDLHWPRDADEDLRVAVHRLLHDVVVEGGAVGYLEPPSRMQTDSWLDDVLADVRNGDGAIVLAGTAQAMGTWRRERSSVFRTSAEVAKVMAHPSARGLGLGVRGNNHGTSPPPRVQKCWS